MNVLASHKLKFSIGLFQNDFNHEKIVHFLFIFVLNKNKE